MDHSILLPDLPAAANNFRPAAPKTTSVSIIHEKTPSWQSLSALFFLFLSEIKENPGFFRETHPLQKPLLF